MCRGLNEVHRSGLACSGRMSSDTTRKPTDARSRESSR
jgi:hypothetical protein